MLQQRRPRGLPLRVVGRWGSPKIRAIGADSVGAFDAHSWNVEIRPVENVACPAWGCRDVASLCPPTCSPRWCRDPRWNLRFPELSLRPGDRIVEVNGTAGNAKAMVLRHYLGMHVEREICIHEEGLGTVGPDVWQPKLGCISPKKGAVGSFFFDGAALKGPRAGRITPNSAEFARILSILGQLWPTLGRHRTVLDESRQRLADSMPNSCQIRPTSPKIGRTRAEFGGTRPKLAEIARTRTTPAISWPSFERRHPSLAESGQNMVNFGRNRADFGRNRIVLDESRQHLAETMPESCQNSVDGVGLLWQTPTGFEGAGGSPAARRPMATTLSI